MKKSIITICSILATFGFVTLGQAEDIPVQNPRLGLEGNTVTMQADITGMPASQKQVKILWAHTTEYSGLSEDSTLSPFRDWKYSTGLNTTSFKTMYSEGWRMVNILPYNSNGAKQFYIVFEK